MKKHVRISVVFSISVIILWLTRTTHNNEIELYDDDENL